MWLFLLLDLGGAVAATGGRLLFEEKLGVTASVLRVVATSTAAPPRAVFCRAGVTGRRRDLGD
jgi:hypothetical protein